MNRTEKACIKCGKFFHGGSDKFYCDDCAKALKSNVMRTRTCKMCGSEYIVNSGRQKYCSDECQREAVLEWQRKHKEGYNKISGQDIKKAQRRKEKKKICVYCGRVFSSSTPTNLCSEYCRKKNRQIKEYQAEIKRGKNVNIGRLLNEQKEYQSKVETNEIEKTI